MGAHPVTLNGTANDSKALGNMGFAVVDKFIRFIRLVRQFWPNAALTCRELVPHASIFACLNQGHMVPPKTVLCHCIWWLLSFELPFIIRNLSI